MNKKAILYLIIFGLLGTGIALFWASGVSAATLPQIDIKSIPSRIDKGESSIIVWKVTNADSCTASGEWSGRKSLVGTKSVRPKKTSQYVLTCFNENGSNSNFAVVGVENEDTEEFKFSFNVSPQTINLGEAVAISWATENAVSCAASGDWSGRKSKSGTETLSPTEDVTYTLSCVGEGEVSTLSRSVRVYRPSSQTSVPTSSNPQTFKVACAVSTNRATIGQRVTFAAGETGGEAPINFVWSGAVNGIGKVQSVNFSSVGTKNARVTATDALDRTQVATCSTNIVAGTVVGTVIRRQVPPPVQTPPFVEDVSAPKFLSYGGIVVPSQDCSTCSDGDKDQPLFASVFSPKSFGLLLWYIFLILFNVALIIAFIYSGKKIWEHYFVPVPLNGNNKNGNGNNYNYLSSPRL